MQYGGEILCIIAQLPITVALTIFIYNNRMAYPLKQNSPLITIVCLNSYLLANIITFSARLTIPNQQWNSVNYNCFLSIRSVNYLSYCYIFISDLPIILYFFKLFRVLTAHYGIFYKRKWLVSFMSSQIKMLIGGFIWCFIVMMIDWILRIEESNQSQIKESIMLYKFMCIQKENYSNIYFNVKYLFQIFLYYVQYTLSIKISKRLSFKGQFNTTVVLILSNNLVSLVHSINNLSYVRQLYYYIMSMYLANTLIIWYYFGNTQPLVSPLPTEVDWQNYTFDILMKQEDCRNSFEYFFEQIGKLYLFDAYLTSMYIQFSQNQPEKQRKLLKKLINVNLKGRIQQFNQTAVELLCLDYKIYLRKKQYNILIQQILQQCEKIFNQWTQTKAKTVLAKKWEKNKEIVIYSFKLNIDI